MTDETHLALIERLQREAKEQHRREAGGAVEVACETLGLDFDALEGGDLQAIASLAGSILVANQLSAIWESMP